MDRLTQLRGAAGSSKDLSFDSSSAQSEAYLTANDSSRYFSISEEDSNYDISPIKDVSLNSAAADVEKSITGTDQLIANLSPSTKQDELLDSYKFDKQIEAANILSGGVDIFDDNENSYDGDGLVIDDNVVDADDKSNTEPKNAGNMNSVDNIADVASKDTEIVLQIDGKNVNAINIGNGLYLYRKEGQEELAAVQIIDDDQQQSSFKFLKVRENAEGNLEVYEEIEIEVPRDTPTKDGKQIEKKTPSLPTNEKLTPKPEVKAVQAVHSEPPVELTPEIPEIKPLDKETTLESKTENLNNKMAKFNETRKSPVIHSTPNKEGIPLTKTMVDQQLHPNRHLDKVKTIEVHTDYTKKLQDIQASKSKDTAVESEVNATGNSSLEPGKTKVKLSDSQVEPVIDTKMQVAPDSKDTAVESEVNATENSSLEPGETKVKLSDSQVEPVVDTKMQVTPDKLETEKSKSFESSSTQEADTTETTQKQVSPHSKLESEDEKSKSGNPSTQDANTLVKEIETKTAVTAINKIEVNIAKKSVRKMEDPTELYVLNNPEQDKSHGLKCSLNTVSHTDLLLKAGLINNSEIMTSSTEAIIVNEKPMVKVKPENIKTDKITIKNENSEANKLQKDLNDAIESLIPKPVVGSSKSTKDIKSVEKIDLQLPQTTDNKNKKVDDIKLHIKRENLRAGTTNTSAAETADVVDCAKHVLRQTLPVPTTEQKVKPTEHSNDSKKQIINTEPVKFEKLNIKEYRQLTHNTVTTSSSSELGISGSKKIETKTPTSLFQGEKLNKIQNLFQDINKATQIISESTKIPMKVTSDDIKMSIKGDTKCVPLNFSLGSKLPLMSATKYCHSSNSKTMVSQTSGQVEGFKGKIISHNVGSNPMLKSEASPSVPEKRLEMSKALPKNLMPVTVRSLPDTKVNLKRDFMTVRANSNVEIQADNNNQTDEDGVPFGKWTEVNRQAYLVKWNKESRVATNTNAKQIKQPNDLNKREFLHKMDIQRNNKNTLLTTAKLNQRRIAPKLNVKTETKTFANKPIITSDITLPVKIETPRKGSSLATIVSIPNKPIAKAEVTKPIIQTVAIAQSNTQQKRNQELIDKTIEGIINRVITAPPEDLPPSTSNVVPTERKNDIKLIGSRTVESNVKNTHPASLDAIEMKMNELHGIPFIERPPHQLPKPFTQDIKTYSKADTNKAKVTSASAASTSNLQKNVKPNVIDVDSEEEIIEHEPVTGDMDVKMKPQIKPQLPTQSPASQTSQPTTITPKNEAMITENDFDKFVRRNSVTYENQLSFESTNAVTKIVEKELPPTKKYSRNELLLAEAKVKSDQKQQHRINHPHKIAPRSANDDAQNKHYQSKLQIAYQSALTAKRKIEPPPPPVLVIEDKPVKVLFVNESASFTPSQLNVQGKELSPKKKIPDIDVVNTNKNAPQDSHSIENVASKKEQDDIKVKGRHQRKQVLTPVDSAELELIEPHDLGIVSSPKKKRKTIEPSLDESPKNVPLKTYLLGRNKVAEETPSPSPPQDLSKAQILCNSPSKVTDTATAIDNLVKAAELLETQSESLNLNSSTHSVDSQGSQATPTKRGRGRPRKYPLGESPVNKSKAETPQKKPRLIDTTPVPRKENTPTDEDTSDEEMIRENWTMGKINENIVCPICKKLFRSENVVFKHVKHCTGPSPNRSDSDNVSRKSQSQESETKSVDSKFDDIDYEPPEEKKPKSVTPKKCKSKDAVSESTKDVDDIVVIEGTPKPNPHESRMSSRDKTLPNDSLACDICGKTFRQLSYLVSHKWQHKKEEPKKVDEIPEVAAKSVFCCEVCKKEFRKLHHLVQHRLIHNPTTNPVRSSRKSSFENIEQRSNNTDSSKPSEDQSAGFRCEPCDKSFRKLHHLVEHRETHDGQNRQKSVAATPASEGKATDPPPQCDICKKTFRKLHHLIEHKEQHLETTSEKSDDKSVKSSLSTKDIIHECRLCYMVFPNEQSLNKHSVFCQHKKKPAVKPPPQGDEEVAIVVDSPEPAKDEVIVIPDTPKPATEEDVFKQEDISPEPLQHLRPSKPVSSCSIEHIDIVDTPEKIPLKENKTKLGETAENTTADKKKLVISKEETKITAPGLPPIAKKAEEKLKETPKPKKIEEKGKEIPKSKKMEEKVKDPIKSKKKEEKVELVKSKKTEEKVKETLSQSKKIDEKVKETSKSKTIEDKANKMPLVKTVPKRKTPVKEKVPAPVSKRPRQSKMLLPVVKKDVTVPESSDDDEVRYMLNPEYKPEPKALFMEVRANKRNSLNIEKPNRESLKRRASLQHPPKPGFKGVLEDRTVPTKITAFLKNTMKVHKPVPVPSTDSDDSDVKYSFPETVADKPSTSGESKHVAEVKRKSVAITIKRRSLSGMAKRKSLGKPPVHKQKEKSPVPVKIIKRRTLGVEHRCDCGELFSSAALLSRHTTLSHTPPRIRRRRSPLPPPARAIPTPARAPPNTRKSADTRTSTDQATTKKGKSVTDKNKSPLKRKSSGNKVESANAQATTTGKGKSRAAHRGVPVPEKMKKLVEKLKG